MTDFINPVQSLGEKPPAGLTKRDRARFLTQELKASVRGLLHHDTEHQATQQSDLFEDAAFDPQKALQPEEPSESSLGDRLSLGARTIVNTIKNPKAVGRNNYTRHAVAKIANHPHDQSTAYDEELLNAHDALSKEQEKNELSPRYDSGNSHGSQHAIGLAEALSRVHRIEQQRENLKSGWVLGRHVVRAKAVRPMISKPERTQFLNEPVAQGQPPQMQTGRYLGHLALWYTNSFTAHRIDDYDEPPFDLRELALTVERLAAVSTPWQTFCHKLRGVYLWEKPSRTFQIMVTYWVLWYLQQLATFAVACILYFTIRNKLHPSTVQSVRERIQRSQDQSQKARAWGELVQKHGGSDWVEPLLDGMGPHLQMQLSDLTMFLERLQNFYRWEQPQQTWLTLGFFLGGFFFLLMTSTQFCVQCLLFVAGCCFFYSFPIATHYPKYRHVVSPWCWMLWAIPDAAELAIDQLQKKVVTRDITRVNDLQQEEEGTSHPNYQAPTAKNNLASSGSSSDTESISTNVVIEVSSDPLYRIQSSDELRFATTLLPLHLRGQVVLTRTHVSFESDSGRSFSHPYADIVEIHKIDLNKDTDQSSTSSGKNKLSRTSHITASLQRSANVQLLPDGLGFTFLQQSPSDVESGALSSSLTQHRCMEGNDPAQVYASTTDTKPALDPRTQPQPDPLGSAHEKDAEAATASREDMEKNHKVGVTLVLNKSDRDKVFTVVLAWSNMKWQPLYSMNRQNKLGVRKSGTGTNETADGGEGQNGNLDDAIKRGLM